jgi:lauroyl/myristoyl acyltransferase
MVVVKADSLQQIRRAIPLALVPGIVRRRVDKLWEDPAARAHAEDQMRFVLEYTERAAEVPALARGYAEHMTTRQYLRFHPRVLTRQPVRDIEWLTTRRDPARGVVLSFAHHNSYDGLFGSLARFGPKLEIVMTPDFITPSAPIAYRQHKAVCAKGGHIISSTSGTDVLARVLEDRGILAIASDFPGRTPVTYLGRKVLGSFGAPRLATSANSPVVIVTTHRDSTGAPYLQVHAPLDPSDYDDPAALLDDILRIHGEAVLEWPEAVESPMARFGRLDDAERPT